ncbi:MAG: RHS repeat-associated core domain-containing protein, partial [Dokdonella sp.]
MAAFRVLRSARASCATILMVALVTFGLGVPLLPKAQSLDDNGSSPLSVDDVPPAHDATVGTMAGQAGADGGAATYHVPIVVPPGRAGMQPSLALAYNSRSGDGVSGLGWTISGLSAIHRCPQTPEQDGATLGVSYTNNDRLCLDGQRLVKVGGTYGFSGAEYRTEVDSYARIYQTGGDLGSNTACFRVEQKDGRILHYGAVATGSPAPSACSTSTAAARVRPSGAAATLSWLVEKIEDRTGNYQSYVYQDYSSGYGENLLKQVTYTGYAADAGDRKVVFNYETRAAASSTATDIGSSALSGGTMMQSQALLSVSTSVAGSTVRTYAPRYVTSIYSHRLLMAGLTECAVNGGSSACHPETKFSYNDSNLNFALTSLNGLALPGSPLALDPFSLSTIGDLDGDGTRETTIAVSQSDGTHVYLVQFTGDRQLHSKVDITGTVLSSPADVDGSGRAAGIQLPTSNGVVSFGVWNLALFPRGTIATSNPIVSVSTNIAFNPLPMPHHQGERSYLADIDGDGKSDVVVISPTSQCGASDVFGQQDGVFVYRNTMTGVLTVGQTAAFTPMNGTLANPTPLFCLARSVNTSGSNPTYSEASIDHIVDFNGDGLADFFLVNHGLAPGTGDFGGIATVQRSGSVISASIKSCAQVGLVSNGIGPTDDCNWSNGYVARWLDINGDGLEDFVIARPLASLGNTWHLRLNQGNGTFGPEIDTGNSTGLIAESVGGTHPYAFRYAGKLPTMDVDGDGKPDLLTPSLTQGNHGFALKMCTITKVTPRANGEGCPTAGGPGFKPDVPDEGQTCAAYSCAENPDGTPPLPANSDPNGTGYPYQWNGLPAFGAYNTATNHGGQGADNSVYHLAALKFVQTGATTFRLDLVETPVVSRLRDSLSRTDDLFGDGLQDLTSSIGCSNITFTNGSPGDNGYWTYPACSVVGDGTWGPAALPDGTPTSAFASNVVLYANVNQGTAGLGGSPGVVSLSPAQQPTAPDVVPADASRSTDALLLSLPIPVMPGLIDAATNGSLDFAAWGYYPLSVPATNAGVPFYSLANPNGSANAYVDDRHYYFQSSMPALFGMAQNSGNTDIYGFRSAFYGYSEAMYNHFGRGFQGFRTITSNSVVHNADAARQLRVKTTYSQKFPLVGKVVQVDTTAPDTNVLIKREKDTWRCTRTNRSTLCPGDSGTLLPVPTGNTVYQPFLDEQVVSNYSLATGAASGHVDTVNAASSATATSGWDAYGNLQNQIVTSADDGSGGIYVSSHTMLATNTYAPADTTNWWVDKLNQSTAATTISYASTHALPTGAAAPSRSVSTSYQWNTDRTPLSQTVQAGVANQQRITTFGYPTPSYGLPTSVSVTASGASPATRATQLSYSQDGTAAAADGYFALTTTNAAGHVTTTRRSPRDGQVTTAIDSNNLQTTTAYDVFGRATGVTFLNAVGGTLLPPASVAYARCTSVAAPSSCAGLGEDANENWAAYRVTTVQSGSPTSVDWFDVLDRKVKHAERGFNGTFVETVTDYDNMGTVAQQSTPFYLGNVPYFTAWSHDRLNRPTQKLAPGAELDSAHGDVVTTYAYTGTKATIKVRGANVSSTCSSSTNLCMDMSRSYDVLGRLEQTTQNNGATANYATTNFWYDGVGNPVAAQDAENNVMRASYNDVGQRTDLYDPDAGHHVYTYDALGEVLRQTDARGVYTDHAYDALGRLTQRTANDTAATDANLKVIRDNWAYDPAGGKGLLDYAQRLRGTSVGTIAQIWRETAAYESATKRLQSQTDVLDGQASPWAIGYTYDANGREQTATYPSTVVVKKGYTTYGDLNQLSDNTSGTVFWTATAKDAWGNLTGETFIGSITGTHSAYASTGQLKQQKWTSGATVLDQLVYGYDSFGNLKSQSVTLASVTGSEAYVFDGLQRLTQSGRSGVPGSPPGVAYSYSPSGNLSNKSDYHPGTTGGYQYGANGCGPHAVSQVNQVGTGAALATFLCDANGNVINGSTLTNAHYDFENRPWSIARVAGNGLPGGQASFEYGANGDRFEEIATSHTTWFGPHGFERTFTSPQTTDRMELGPVTLSRVCCAGYGIKSNLRDRLGSTVALGFPNGSGLWQSRTYDAFGKVRNGDLSDKPDGKLGLLVPTLRGFTGHEHVDDLQLIHMNGRMYDPALGRFLSVDPVIQFPTNTQGLNPYSYILNNPLSGKDPTGYQSCTVTKDNSCTVMNNDDRSADKLGHT